MNYSHAVIINAKILEPYHHHNERLFNKLREAHDYAPQVAQHMAYQALLVDDGAFSSLFKKITAFVLKTPYEPLTLIEYSVLDRAFDFYKKGIEETKTDLASRMVTSDVIDAYVESQQSTVILANKVLNRMLKIV